MWHTIGFIILLFTVVLLVCVKFAFPVDRIPFWLFAVAFILANAALYLMEVKW